MSRIDRRGEWVPKGIRRVVLTGLALLTVVLLLAVRRGVNGVPEPRTSYNSQVEAGPPPHRHLRLRLVPHYSRRVGRALAGRAAARSLLRAQLYRGPAGQHRGQPGPVDSRPAGVEPGTAMPNLGVSEDQARDIAVYLYHQPSPLRLDQAARMSPGHEEEAPGSLRCGSGRTRACGSLRGCADQPGQNAFCAPAARSRGRPPGQPLVGHVRTRRGDLAPRRRAAVRGADPAPPAATTPPRRKATAETPGANGSSGAA